MKRTNIKKAKGTLISPLDVAFILRNKKLGITSVHDYLYDTWRMNKELLTIADRKTFITETMYWMDYLENKKATEEEIQKIKTDHKNTSHIESFSKLSSETYSTDLFFKRLRLELTTEQKRQVRARISTVMKNYGYQRKTRLFTEYMQERLTAYEITLFQKDVGEVGAGDVSKADMVSFRLADNEDRYEAIWNEQACIISLCPPVTSGDYVQQEMAAGTAYMKIQHAKTDYSIRWNVNHLSNLGDVMLFYCPEDASSNLERIECDYVIENSSRYENLVAQEKAFYADNANKIIALGVLAENPDNKPDCEITDLIWLDIPIDLSALETEITVNRFSQTTYLSAEEWLDIRKEIKRRNQLIRV